MFLRNALRITSLCALVLVPFGAHATTVARMDVDTLADRAELIFVGTALRAETAQRPISRFPYTFVTFSVDQVFKGSTPGRELTLRFEGGKTATGFVSIDGMPRFSKGERYLLFVRGNGLHASPVYGWWQGQIRFQEEPSTGREILVDHEGTPLRGIEKGRWLRESGPDRKHRATLQKVEGVRISDVAPGETERPSLAAPAPPESQDVIEQLETFLRTRSKHPAFLPGRLVLSSRPGELIFERSGSVTTPRGQEH